MEDFSADGGKGKVQPVYITVKDMKLVQIFPTHYSQKNSCALIGSPAESGKMQIDNRVIQPTVVQFTGIVKYKERSIFTTIRRTMKSQKLENLTCKFMTKAGEIKNMIIEDCEEVGESNRYDGIEIKMTLKEYLEHNASKGGEQ